MAIIIEGHDNSGKSTLAREMAEYMGLIVQESEGPPRSDEEINARVDAYERLEGRLFVRHPVVSNAIYGKFREEGDPITEGRRMIFYEANHVLVYCDAQRAYEGHVVKGHDSEQHLKLLDDNAEGLLREYRLWAAQHAHFVYRIGDDIDRLIAAVYFFQCFDEA